MYRLFGSKEQLKEYIRTESHSFKREIGLGGEGISYLGYNGKVYKMFYKASNTEYRSILTEDDIKLEHVCLPEQMYILMGRLAAYRTRYVKGDILINIDSIIMGDNPGELDMEDLIKAYEEFLPDVEAISRLKYFMYDLSGNLTFDGHSFCAIDTCDYKRMPDLSFEEVYKKNIQLVHYAINEELFHYYDSLGLEAPNFTEEYKKYKEGTKKR